MINYLSLHSVHLCPGQDRQKRDYTAGGGGSSSDVFIVQYRKTCFILLSPTSNQRNYMSFVSDGSVHSEESPPFFDVSVSPVSAGAGSCQFMDN